MEQTTKDKAFTKAVEELLQEVGDSIADVLELIEKEKWQDDNNHPVRLNIKVVALANSLIHMTHFRAERLNYINPYKTNSRN